MYRTEDAIPRWARLKKALGRAVRLLGSLKLAVVLLVVLAGVIATATLLETNHGREHAQWYVYRSGWFVGLLALLGVNVFCAALSRWPWKRRQTGFVVTHSGLLVLLFGSILTFVGGIEGQVTLGEGESTAKMTVPQQSQISVSWVGRPDEPPYEFSFDPGPVNWRPGTSLDAGRIDGVGVRVLRYYRHAQAVEEWVADESGTGGPAVRVQLEGPQSSARVEHVLADQDDGDEALVGPVRLQLQRAASDAMLGPFLEPPTDLGQKGLLLAYYQDRAERIPVDDRVGKKVELGGTGAAVEIVEYLPNARPDHLGKFHSVNADPRNPVLDLRVHLPGRKEPVRQLAFAKSPLVNLDAVNAQSCPVKFHYHHPAVVPPPTVAFLQTSDGKLYCRATADKRTAFEGEVREGSAIPVAGGFTFTVVEHLPQARQKVVFEPANAEAGEKEKAEAAAEIEVTAGGQTQKVWVQRNHPEYGARTIATPEGLLRVRLGHGELPLGFSLGLVEFNRDVNPGGVGNAAYSSVVRVTDKHRGLEEEYDVSMNQPLTFNRLTLYQSGFNDAGHGRQASTFSVVYDPGRPFKYAGSLMVCLGIAIMFYMRAYFFQGVPRLWGERAVSPAGGAAAGEPREGEPALHVVLDEQPDAVTAGASEQADGAG